MKPPKNFRYKPIKTCWTCRHRVIAVYMGEARGFVCERDPDNILWDTTELKYVEQVCDRWSK